MKPTRREFLDRLAVGATALGGAAIGLGALPDDLVAAGVGVSQSTAWDLTWPDRLTGSVRAVYDVPEIEHGLGVWRASIWARQYEQAMGVPARECSTALVIRHLAIILAMKQEYWDRYGVGKDGSVRHPLTREATTRNPALLGEGDGIPQPQAGFSLDGFHSRGGVTLACDLAITGSIVPTIARVDGVTREVARERALALLVPGVILQPSGVFAVMLAQQRKQANYIRAS